MSVEREGRPETRRSARILWRRPVLVSWWSEGGPVRELAETEIVNAHGGLLRLPMAPPIGHPVRLHDSSTGHPQEARVVWSQQEQATLARMAVELTPPSETFWGVRIPIIIH